MEILDVYDKYKSLTDKKILKNQYNELENRWIYSVYVCSYF